MKKSLTLALALMVGTSVATTAFAANGTENPFKTVPANHWAYPAVTQLVKAGLIDGYGDGDFRGDRPATRYEMATLVAKAMSNVDKADKANKALLDKLSQEYATELNNLGVRVDKLEKKVNGLGNMKIGGELRFRYDYAGSGVQGFTGDASDKQRNGQVRYRLQMNANLDDNWKMNARYESAAPKLGGSGSDNPNNLTRAWLEGDIAPSAHLLFGRGNFKTFNAYTGWDKDNWDGAGLTLGKNVTLDLYAMKYGGTNTTTNYKTVLKSGKYTTTASNDFSQKNTWFKLIQIKYPVNKDLTIAAQWLKNPLQDRKEYGASYDTIGAGFKYDFNDKLTLGAEYAVNRAGKIRTTTAGILDEKSFTAQNSKGYEIKLDYGDLDKSKVGTWGTWVGYRHADDGFDRGDMTTGFRHDNAKAARMNNIKGFETGFDYTFIKNTKFEIFYIAGKPVNGLDYKTPGGNDNKHMAYAQMELFF